MCYNIKDGIVCPPTFAKEPRKVLFILKEANDPKSEGKWKLTELLYNGGAPKSPTWRNVAIWSYLMRHYGDASADISWKRVKKISRTKNDRAPEFRKIAVININKKSGSYSHTSDDGLYDGFAKDIEAQNEIRCQIESEIQPDIIFCGGRIVAECLKKYIKILNGKK